jgi:TnpA family transposase
VLLSGESRELRRRYHAGLKKSEQRHSFEQVICTFRQGRIADRGIEAQQFRASGLNLVIAAIVVESGPREGQLFIALSWVSCSP